MADVALMLSMLQESQTEDRFNRDAIVKQTLAKQAAEDLLQERAGEISGLEKEIQSIT